MPSKLQYITIQLGGIVIYVTRFIVLHGEYIPRSVTIQSNTIQLEGV